MLPGDLWPRPTGSPGPDVSLLTATCPPEPSRALRHPRRGCGLEAGRPRGVWEPGGISPVSSVACVSLGEPGPGAAPLGNTPVGVRGPRHDAGRG